MAKKVGKVLPKKKNLLKMPNNGEFYLDSKKNI